MKDKKKLNKYLFFISGTLILALICFGVWFQFLRKPVVPIEDEKTPTTAGTIEVYQTMADIAIIPDRFNTGIDPSVTLKSIYPNDTYNSITFRSGSGDTKNVLDFVYKNTDVSGTVVFENIDFSAYPIVVQKEDLVVNTIKLVFKNCKFSTFSTIQGKSNVSYSFERCTLNSFYGSNATFERCKFGGTYGDGIVPFYNVTVNNSFFTDMSYPMDQANKVAHTDGTQIYGSPGVDAENILYKNCRFEIPQLSGGTAESYINACIMIQLEYSNAKNILFEDCYINGGGFSIYAWNKNSGYSLTDVKLKNIKVGNLKRYGTLYHTTSAGVTLDNIVDTDALYVASVWKETDGTHFSVTNDTNKDRKLKILTNEGEYFFDIKACPSWDTIGSMTMADFPFDMNISIPVSAQWAVCYDVTNSTEIQIRFANWTNEKVYLVDPTKLISDSQVPAETDLATAPAPAPTPVLDDTVYLQTGTCGDTISFSLSSTGDLVLSGSGITFNYTSSKPAPWFSNISSIKTITVGEGITELGTQLFRKAINVTTVTLPEGLTKIGNNAFIGCTSLSTLSLPSTLTYVGKYAFNATALSHVEYFGTEESWTTVIIEANNDALVNTDIIIPIKEVVIPHVIISEGQCGDSITWTLTDTGILTLTGTGTTYNYTSYANAPWYSNRETINTIVISDGITGLGTQLFRNCKTITAVTIPKGVTSIGGNVFIGCSNLVSVNIPLSVTSIGRYAFESTGLKTINYEGTSESWNLITIGSNNSPFTSATFNYSTY